MGSRFRLATIFAWCLLIASTASAARFEIRNELTRNRTASRPIIFQCWSSLNQLGQHRLNPLESKTWSFTPVSINIPFFYTYFECTFFTAFSTSDGQTTTVFAGERNFRRQCDNPEMEECIWVAKPIGVYLRKISKDSKGQRLYQDELRMKWIMASNKERV